MSRTVIEELVTIFDFDVDDSQLRRANQAMDRWNRQATQGARNADAWGRRLQGAVLAYVGFDAALRAGAGMVNVIETNERYLAQLETMMGSQQAAAAEFERLDQFAAQTPYSLDQSVQAFIRLKALGLDPSEEAMRSYGDTASAMGMDLIQFIEAVADASVGEFERLKEFGIKASSEGDRVRFTFQGATTEVGKNAEEIQAYLQSIGQGEFAGSMARMMDTVGGRLSNLRQAWGRLVWDMSKGEMSDGLSRVLDALTGIVEAANDGSSGIGKLVGGGLDKLGASLEWVEENADDVATAIAYLGSAYLVSRIMRITSTIQAMGNAALAAQLKMLLIPAAIVAIVGLVALFSSEFDKWGGKQTTLIDLLIEKYPTLGPPLERLKGHLDDVREHGADAFRVFLQDIQALVPWVEHLGVNMDAVADAIERAVDAMDNFSIGFGRDNTVDLNPFRMVTEFIGQPIADTIVPSTAVDADGRAVPRVDSGGGALPVVDTTGRDRALEAGMRAAARSLTPVAPVLVDVPVSRVFNISVEAREGESPEEFGRRAADAAAQRDDEYRREVNRSARRAGGRR